METLELLRERLGQAVEDHESFYEMLHPNVVWDISDTTSPEAALQAAGLDPDG